jgi:hypothetical protein
LFVLLKVMKLRDANVNPGLLDITTYFISCLRICLRIPGGIRLAVTRDQLEWEFLHFLSP